ncbi:MAG: hypothetical protein WBA23_22870, partial [Tunicatimonas sp.]|uniref:hypothetical protein n=1 Tax=Tunicatimonas sp. TaxID=1940096 RepID=UPI003C74EAE6
MNRLLIYLFLVLLTAAQVLATSIHKGGLPNIAQSSVDACLTITISVTNQLELNTSAQEPNKFIRTRSLSKRLKNNKRA